MSFLEDEVHRSAARTQDAIQKTEDRLLDEMNYDRKLRGREGDRQRKHTTNEADRILTAQELELAGTEAVLVANHMADLMDKQGSLANLDPNQEPPYLHVTSDGDLLARIARARVEDHKPSHFTAIVPAHLYPRVAALKGLFAVEGVGRDFVLGASVSR